jgi:hypothetical protein
VPKKPPLKPFDQYTAPELDALIGNFRRHAFESDPDFARLLAERERRSKSGLDFEKTRMAIRRAAAERRYLTYSDIAAESGLDIKKVHWLVGDHLTRLCEYAHRKHWPLISAIVVNKAHQETGALNDYSLSGFTAVARALGYVVTDEESFLREQQEKTFAWAKVPEAIAI